MHREDYRRGDGERDGIKVPSGVVGDLIVERGIDDVVRAGDQHGVAVGCGLGGSACADIAAGAADIFHIELRPDLLG